MMNFYTENFKTLSRKLGRPIWWRTVTPQNFRGLYVWVQVKIFILKFMRQYKGTKITKTVLNKKDKARGLSGRNKNPC